MDWAELDHLGEATCGLPQDTLNDAKTWQEKGWMDMAILDIGRYKYQDQMLAQDAFGIMYEGTDSTTGEPVYIKQMRPLGRKERPHDGIQALQGITHVALARAHDEVILKQQRYVVVSKPEGELLNLCLPVLRQGGIWGRYQLLCALVDVCKAVEALHGIGLVHGGINPASIVLKRRTPLQARLLCFASFEPLPTSRYIQENEQMLYLPQEQLRGRGDFASDVYALGMLLYMAFGKGKPFASESCYQLAEQIVWGALAPFSPDLEDLDEARRQAIGPDIETVGAIAAKSLQRDPRARYATVSELRRPLEQIAHRLSPTTLGLALYNNRQFQLSAAVLQEAVSSPDAPLAYVLLGRLYGLELGDYERGVVAFKRALKENSSLESARLGLAEIYLRQRRYTLAKREFGELLKTRPHELQLNMGYAEMLRQSGDPQGALNVLRRIQEVDPYALPAYIQAVRISLSQEDLKEAEIDCKHAVERIIKVIKHGNLDPEQVAEVYFLRGLLHRKQGRNEQAIDWLERAVNHIAVHQQSHALLAELYAEAGQPDKAIHHFLTSLNINPDQEGILEDVERIFTGQESRG